MQNKILIFFIFYEILKRAIKSKELKKKHFWNNKCIYMSNRLWNPSFDQTNVMKSNLSIISDFHRTNNKYELPEFMLETSSKWTSGETVIKNYKIKLYPTSSQKEIFRNWFGTSRFVYNRALNYINQANTCCHELYYLFNTSHKYNFYDMRDLFVTKKGNEKFLNNWEFETPKDIRVGVIKEFTTNLSTNINKIKNSSIKNFKLKYKSKKDKSISITIPKSAIKFNQNENIEI